MWRGGTNTVHTNHHNLPTRGNHRAQLTLANHKNYCTQTNGVRDPLGGNVVVLAVDGAWGLSSWEVRRTEDVVLSVIQNV